MPTLEVAAAAWARREGRSIDGALEAAERLIEQSVEAALHSQPRFDLLPIVLGPIAKDQWESRVRAGEAPAGVEHLVGSTGDPMRPQKSS